MVLAPFAVLLTQVAVAVVGPHAGRLQVDVEKQLRNEQLKVVLATKWAPGPRPATPAGPSAPMPEVKRDLTDLQGDYYDGKLQLARQKLEEADKLLAGLSRPDREQLAADLEWRITLALARADMNAAEEEGRRLLFLDPQAKIDPDTFPAAVSKLIDTLRAKGTFTVAVDVPNRADGVELRVDDLPSVPLEKTVVLPMGGDHRLTFKAPGFAPVTQTVSNVGSITLEFALPMALESEIAGAFTGANSGKVCEEIYQLAGTNVSSVFLVDAIGPSNIKALICPGIRPREKSPILTSNEALLSWITSQLHLTAAPPGGSVPPPSGGGTPPVSASPVSRGVSVAAGIGFAYLDRGFTATATSSAAHLSANAPLYGVGPRVSAYAPLPAGFGASLDLAAAAFQLTSVKYSPAASAGSSSEGTEGTAGTIKGGSFLAAAAEGEWKYRPADDSESYGGGVAASLFFQDYSGADSNGVVTGFTRTGLGLLLVGDVRLGPAHLEAGVGGSPASSYQATGGGSATASAFAPSGRVGVRWMPGRWTFAVDAGAESAAFTMGNTHRAYEESVDAVKRTEVIGGATLSAGTRF